MKNHSLNKTFIVLILGALSTVTPFSIDMYLPAFAKIAEQFGTTTTQLSLSVSSYFVGMALGQMLYGPLLDRYGRKKPMYVGLSIFMMMSIACLYSPNVNALIAFRFLQALGGSVAWVAAVTMVRDFFPVKESVKIFSLLVLVIGVSPLLAPTVGGFITTWFGWQWIFIALAAFVFLMLLVILFFLPEGHKPDTSISLKPKPMLNGFYVILKNPQFYTYALAGAFSFSSLFVYVAGSPMIFMELHQLTPQLYGGMFALLSVGFISSSQLNIFLVRKFASHRIFQVVLYIQVASCLLFLFGWYIDALNLYTTVALYFVMLACIGINNPNATAIALAPFSKNAGRASALQGFIQIGSGALASSGVGIFNSKSMLPVICIQVIITVLALFILLIGKRNIDKLEIGEPTIESAAH